MTQYDDDEYLIPAYMPIEYEQQGDYISYEDIGGN